MMRRCVLLFVLSLLLALAMTSPSSSKASVTVKLQQETLLLSAPEDLRFRVTDSNGASVSGATVTLKKVLNSRKENLLANTQELTAAGHDEFVFNLAALKPEPGAYTLDLSVRPPADSQLLKADSIHTTVRAVTSATVGDAEVQLLDSDGNPIRKYSVRAGGSLESGLVARSAQSLLIAFELKNRASTRPLRLQQAFVRFHSLSHPSSDTIFPALFGTKRYELKLGVAELGAELQQLSGEYELELVVGDAFIEESFTRRIGSVHLQFDSSSSGQRDEQSYYGSRPELSHIFRVPERRPPAVVSLAFSGLVAVPLVIVLLAALLRGVRLALPSTPLGLLAVVGFSLAKLSVVIVLAEFWFGANMIITLRRLSIACTAAVAFGYFALRSRAASRDKQKSD